MKSLKILISSALILAFCAATAHAVPGGRSRARDGRVAGIAAELQRLNLSKDQKREIALILQKYRAEAQTVTGKMKESGKGLVLAVHAEVFDDAAIRAAHQFFAADSEEFAVLRSKILLEVREVLTPEQQAMLKKARAKFIKQMQTRGALLKGLLWEWVDNQISGK